MILIERLNKDINNNILWYVSLFLLPVIFYFSEFSDMSFTQDELRHALSTEVDPQWLSQGRFGMYFLTWLYSANPIFPYVGVLFSSIMSLISVRVFFEKVCHIYDFPILLSVLFISCPFIYYLYVFSTVSFSIGVIYLLITLSIYCLFLENKLYIFLSALLVCFAISIYQSAITVFILMLLIAVFYRCLKGERYLCYFLRGFATAFLSLIFYVVMKKIVEIYLPGNYPGYINGFINFEFSSSYLIQFLNAIILRISDFLLASNNVLPRENIFQSVSILFFLILLIVNFLFKKTILIFLFLCMLLTPFLLEVLSTNSLPARSYIALPLLFTFIFYWPLMFVIKNVIMKYFMAIVTILYIMLNFMNLNKFIFYDHNAWKVDQRLAEEMVHQILSLDELEYVVEQSHGSIPLHSVGYLPYQNSSFNKAFENIGKGYFSWGDNELQNSSVLFNGLGWDIFTYAYPNFADVPRHKRATYANTVEHINTIRKLPNWPMPGSITVIDDFVVIKLSDYSEAQVRTVCSEVAKGSINSCLVAYNPNSIKFEINDSINKSNLYNKLYEFDSESFLSLEHSVIEIVGNTYQISSPASDSFLVLPPIELDGNMVLRINIDYNSPESLSLYFKYPNEVNYSENNVIRLKPINGENVLYITLPAELFKEGLRIDFSNSAETFKLHGLEVYGNAS